MKKIKESDKDLSASMEAILTVGVDTVNNSTLYTTKAFKGGLGARNVLQYSMSDLATAGPLWKSGWQAEKHWKQRRRIS